MSALVEEQLTTRQVAEALKVSESSVKRWCDRGVIPTVRTAGGHRRVPLPGFMRYLEQTNQQVAQPLPGFTSTRSGNTEATTARLKTSFAEALSKGDEATCRSILSQVYAREKSIAAISDDFIASTFHEIGERWDCGDLEIYQERRGCEICSRLLHELRRLLPEPPITSPLAIGAAVSGDHYTMPGLLIDMVLRENGWRTMNLGTNLPLETIGAAAADYKPNLLWLSVSHLEDEAAFEQSYQAFHQQLPEGSMVALGGRALHDRLRPNLAYTSFCDNMRQLSELSKAFNRPRSPITASDN